VGWVLDTTLYEFDPLEPGDPRTVGGYVLRARIGAGGMGRVYLSFTPGGRAVAVKLIRGELAADPEFRERFAREVSIAQQVNGIHIAQLIDSGSDRGVPWLASAYVAGPSLAQVVSAVGPLPPATVLALAGRIAGSLGAIHATGMVHRDLKPGNILLAESGPKVIDFGIVRAATPTATGRSSHRTFIGSPPFMAPEQIRGRKITPATDVFALGATIYYLSTGESAFRADFADGVLYRVIHDEPDYEACPQEVRELIRACLRKQPEERPTTQRIIDGCRAAGAGPEAPLPEAVRAMIEARSQALAILASRPAEEAEHETEEGAETGSAAEQETADDAMRGEQTPVAPSPPLTPPDLHGATTAAPPLAAAGPAVEPAVDPSAESAAISADNWVPLPGLAAPTLPVGTPGTKPTATASAGSAVPPPRARRGRTVLVAGASSLVTAVAVVVAVLLWPSSPASTNSGGQGDQGGVGSSVAPTSVTQPSNTTTSTSGASANSVLASTASGAAGSEPVQWHGQVLISSSSVDLDSVPVNNGATSHVSIYDSSTGFGNAPYGLSALPYGSMTLAVWSGSTPPTRSQCYDEVSSQGANEVSVADGTMVCVITVDGRVALVQVTDDQAESGEAIMAEVTVWSQVGSGSTSTATASRG